MKGKQEMRPGGREEGRLKGCVGGAVEEMVWMEEKTKKRRNRKRVGR
jgi:hypothetical protein